jgi:hypothetical protein
VADGIIAPAAAAQGTPVLTAASDIIIISHIQRPLLRRSDNVN